MNATTTRTRKPPKDRKAEVLEGAIAAAVKYGWMNFTRQQVADASGEGVSAALVHHYLGDMAAIRKLVMQQAVKRSIPRLVAEGLANRSPVAAKASDELKEAARKAI